MKSQKLPKILFIILISGLFFANNGGETPSGSEHKAYTDLARGVTHWPVWQVNDGTIQIDGKISDQEWRDAHVIYQNGDWFWDKNYYSSPKKWDGVQDVIALWRVLCDSKNLYVSCLFLDNNHQEGNRFEPEAWVANDAIQLDLITNRFAPGVLDGFFKTLPAGS